MLQQLKVLRAAVALHQFTVEEVAAYAAVPVATVRTVLRRHVEWFTEIGSEPTGKRGGKWTVYQASDEAAESVAQLVEEHRKATGSPLEPPPAIPEPPMAEQRLGAIEHALLMVPALGSGERPHRLERLHEDIEALRTAVEGSHDSRLALRYSATSQLVGTLRHDWPHTAARELKQAAERWNELLRTLDEAGLEQLSELLVERLQDTPLVAKLRRRVGSGSSRSSQARVAPVGENRGRAIGIELRPYKFAAVLVDAGGERMDEYAADLVDMRSESVVNALSQAVRWLTPEGCSEDDVALGVQLGGPVDTESGTVIFYKKTMLRPGAQPDVFEWEAFEWKDFDLGPRLQQLTGLRTVIENDANAFAVREKWFGVGRDTGNFVVVLMREGIGGSVVTNGELYPGPVEIGHFITSKGGFMFSETGELGALETAAGVTAILDRVNWSVHVAESGEATDSAFVKRIGNLATAVERADEHSEAGRGAADAFSGAGAGIACAIGYLVNFSAPTHVVLCVPPSMWNPRREATKQFRKGVDSYTRFIPFEPFRRCKLTAQPIHIYDGALGAALVALERCFDSRPMNRVVDAELVR